MLSLLFQNVLWDSQCKGRHGMITRRLIMRKQGMRNCREELSQFLAVLGSWTSVQIWITVPLYIKLLLMAVLGSWTSVQIWITVLLYIKFLFNEQWQFWDHGSVGKLRLQEVTWDLRGRTAAQSNIPALFGKLNSLSLDLKFMSWI